MQERYPDIRYHISSGNAEYVLETLDKGLFDFGLIFGGADPKRYDFFTIPYPDTWGVLMRRDSPLAEKEAITPEDLWDKPLILSHQRNEDLRLSRWFQCEPSQLHVVATYNLLYNASLLVDEGLGYAVTLDKLLNTQGSSLCFARCPRGSWPRPAWSGRSTRSSPGPRACSWTACAICSPSALKQRKTPSRALGTKSFAAKAAQPSRAALPVFGDRLVSAPL